MPGRSSSSGRLRQIISLLLKVISNQALQPDSRAAFGIFSWFTEELKVLQLLTMKLSLNINEMTPSPLPSQPGTTKLPFVLAQIRVFSQPCPNLPPPCISFTSISITIITRGLSGPYFSRAFLKGVGV